MTDVTVKKLADLVGTSTERLLLQFHQAGLTQNKSDDLVTLHDKQILLSYLKKVNQESSASKKIVNGNAPNITDKILSALLSGCLNKKNISFSQVRSIAGTDYNIWPDLGRSKSILSSERQLDQYLYSYGPMIQSQWTTVLKGLKFPEGDVQLNDYACGQGLASLLLHDAFPDSDLSRITKVNLIEPSFVALNRAEGLIKCCYPKANINIINKYLDDVEECEICLSDDAVKIHLFSNILDIDGFNQFDLLNKAFKSSGRHLLLAVSHDREHNGGSGRLRETYAALLNDEYKEWYRVIDEGITQFDCQNGQRAIAFHMGLEI